MSHQEVEFPCPACGTVNSIAEAKVPESGEIRCGQCGETVALHPGPAKTLSGGHPVRGSSLPPAPSSLTDTLIRVEEYADETVSGAAEDVCCPQCGHRFPVEEGRGGGSTVLVVEDTDFFLHLATEVLGRRYRTIGVRTVAEARQVLATSPVHLVVLDLTLPDAEGTEVLRALPRPDIPVLIYTSRDETSLLGPEWQALSSLGASDVIHKGINIEDALLRKAEELLAHQPV
ncbi:MAG: response regulator [Acidobacteriota bacterium]|nr:response regulator [Acidobacteriota bacterium]MDQ7087899.1 response regulator [Acidobacteriota bacterium]